MPLARKTLAGMNESRVTVTWWEARAPWLQRRQVIRGLVLDIDSHGTTRTYGARCLDTACELVLEYLLLSRVDVAADVTIIWTDRFSWRPFSCPPCRRSPLPVAQNTSLPCRPRAQ